MRGISPVNERFPVTKLVNKYAESYIYKEEENNQLKKTIKDLRTTLKYSKEMIDVLTSDLKLDEKLSVIYERSNSEINFMNKKIEELNNEVGQWRDKVIYSEKIAIDNINKEKNQISKLEDRIFILENQIEKKNNEIGILKKKYQKLESYQDSGLYVSHEREVFVIEPCQAVNHINDELLMYKEVYKNLSESFKALQNNIKSYEKTIEDLQYEVGTMVKELREKDKLIAMQITRDGKNLDMSRDLTDNAKTSKSKVNTPNKKDKKDKDKNILRNLNFCITNDVYNYKLDTSEWRDVIRIVGFNEEDYNQMFDVHKNRKAIDCIDVLLSIVLEKNVQIEVLNLENKKLNSENQVLYDETTIYKKQVSSLEEKIESLKLIEEKYEKLRTSQINAITHKVTEKESKNSDLSNQGNNKLGKTSHEYNDYLRDVLLTNENQVLYNPTTVSKHHKKTKSKFDKKIRKSTHDNGTSSNNSINSSDLIDSNNETKEKPKHVKYNKKESESSNSSCHNTYVKLTSKHNFTLYNSNNSSSNNNLESTYLFKNKLQSEEKNKNILASKIYNSQKIRNKNINKNNTNIYNITVSTLANNHNHHVSDKGIHQKGKNKDNEFEYINLNSVGNIKKSSSKFDERLLNTENDIYKKVLNKLNRLTLNNESLQSMSNQSTEKNKYVKNVDKNDKDKDKETNPSRFLGENIKSKGNKLDSTHLKSILQKKNLQLALGSSDDKTESSVNKNSIVSTNNNFPTQINLNQINEEFLESTLPKDSNLYNIGSDCLISLKAPRESPGQIINSTSNKSYKKASSRDGDFSKFNKRTFSKASKNTNTNTSNNNTPSKNGNMKHRLLERLKSLENHLTNNNHDNNKPVCIYNNRDNKINNIQLADSYNNPEYLVTEQNLSIDKKHSSNNDSYLISIKPDYTPNDRKNTKNTNERKNTYTLNNRVPDCYKLSKNNLIASNEKIPTSSNLNNNNDQRYNTLQVPNKKLNVFTQNNKIKSEQSPSNSSNFMNNNQNLLNNITNKVLNSVNNNLTKVQQKNKNLELVNKFNNNFDNKIVKPNLSTYNYKQVVTKSNSIKNINQEKKNYSSLSTNFNNKTSKASVNFSKKLSNMEDILSNSINDNDSIVLINNNIKEFTFDSCTSAEFKKEIEKNNEEIDFESDEKDDVMEKLDQMSIRIQTANY